MLDGEAECSFMWGRRLAFAARGGALQGSQFAHPLSSPQPSQHSVAARPVGPRRSRCCAAWEGRPRVARVSAPGGKEARGSHAPPPPPTTHRAVPGEAAVRSQRSKSGPAQHDTEGITLCRAPLPPTRVPPTHAETVVWPLHSSPAASPPSATGSAKQDTKAQARWWCEFTGCAWSFLRGEGLNGGRATAALGPPARLPATRKRESSSLGPRPS
jgi:hypothetical protein